MLHRKIVLALAGAGLLGAVALATGQTADAPPPAPPSLKTVAVPEPPNLSDYVQDKQAAILLGKALFWDMQVGSDGVTACATCHFRAGADSRSINQMNPGTLGRDTLGRPAPDRVLDRGANAHLVAELFPLRVLSNPADRASPPLRDSNDIVSSQGVFATIFQDTVPGQPEELVLRRPDPVFRAGGLNVRQVPPRHAPSVINAVFNHRNFWDGSAQNEFNGVNQWGDRDPNALVLKAVDSHGLAWQRVRLVNASLASQAVTPILSAQEMSADGRIGPDIASKLGRKSGKKLASGRPLGGQLVHPDDSVLGKESRWPQPGLKVDTYEALIEKAFRREWWKSNTMIRVAPNGSVAFVPNSGGPRASDDYTLMEYNFSLFFGLALQLYQATLVSDDTPYDRWREGRGVLSPQALVGLDVFLGQAARTLPDGTRRAGARCINCHAGAEFTDASVASIATKGITRLREGQDLDRGWNNIGVRPTREDAAVGGKDPFGKWLSATRQAAASPLAPATGRYIAVDGAFKVPGLRNVELTAPYFHNGGYLTLDSVVDFYSRGGDFGGLYGLDGGPIQPLSVPQLSLPEKQGLVAFLQALTDERVRLRRAPFDHPQLLVPNGQLENGVVTTPDPLRPGQALDRMREVPAVGRQGAAVPLPGFMEYR